MNHQASMVFAVVYFLVMRMSVTNAFHVSPKLKLDIMRVRGDQFHKKTSQTMGSNSKITFDEQQKSKINPYTRLFSSSSAAIANDNQNNSKMLGPISSAITKVKYVANILLDFSFHIHLLHFESNDSLKWFLSSHRINT